MPRLLCLPVAAKLAQGRLLHHHAALCLQASLLLRYKFELAPGSPKAMYETGILLSVKGGLHMVVKRRTHGDASLTRAAQNLA